MSFDPRDPIAGLPGWMSQDGEFFEPITFARSFFLERGGWDDEIVSIDQTDLNYFRVLMPANGDPDSAPFTWKSFEDLIWMMSDAPMFFDGGDFSSSWVEGYPELDEFDIAGHLIRSGVVDGDEYQKIVPVYQPMCARGYEMIRRAWEWGATSRYTWVKPAYDQIQPRRHGKLWMRKVDANVKSH